MSDDKTNKAAQASIASVQRLAMRISELSEDKHEDAFKIARKSYEEGIVAMGRDPTGDFAQRWLDLQIEGIRALVREISGRSGKA
jgi:hypothetical protein